MENLARNVGKVARIYGFADYVGFCNLQVSSLQLITADWTLRSFLRICTFVAFPWSGSDGSRQS